MENQVEHPNERVEFSSESIKEFVEVLENLTEAWGLAIQAFSHLVHDLSACVLDKAFGDVFLRILLMESIHYFGFPRDTESALIRASEFLPLDLVSWWIEIFDFLNLEKA